MVAYYFNGDYNEVIEIGKKVLNIKKDKYSYSRIHFIFFFMALAYYEKKMPKEAIQYLNKSIYMLMSEYKPTDVSYIAIFDRFREMLDDLGANSKIIIEFRKRYNIWPYCCHSSIVCKIIISLKYWVTIVLYNELFICDIMKLYGFLLVFIFIIFLFNYESLGYIDILCATNKMIKGVI